MALGEETYHDYVIRDGKFIGRFDEMYARFEDPWTQSAQPNKYSRMSGILHLRSFGVQSVLECGCGLGYYADWIRKETGIVPKSIDISANAISRAKVLFPDLDFEVGDISRDLIRYKGYECVLFAEIIWYLLPDLQTIFETLKAEFKGKYLLVNQVFYKGTQKYGNNYFTSPEEFIRYVPFTLLGTCQATRQMDTTLESSMFFQIT